MKLVFSLSLAIREKLKREKLEFYVYLRGQTDLLTLCDDGGPLLPEDKVPDELRQGEESRPTQGSRKCVHKILQNIQRHEDRYGIPFRKLQENTVKLPLPDGTIKC